MIKCTEKGITKTTTNLDVFGLLYNVKRMHMRSSILLFDFQPNLTLFSVVTHRDKKNRVNNK